MLEGTSVCSRRQTLAPPREGGSGMNPIIIHARASPDLVAITCASGRMIHIW